MHASPLPAPVRPQPTADGWWPRLSPNGRYVAYGNVQTWLTELRTNRTIQISGPMQTSHAAVMGWYDESNLAILNHEQTAKDVWFYNVISGTLVRQPQFSGLDSVNFFEASAGHIGTSRPYVLTWDGRVLPEQSHGMSVNGEWMVTANPVNDRWSLQRFKNGVLHDEFDAPIPANFWSVNARGDVLYGIGQQRIRYADGRGDDDATTTPWRSEGIGVSLYVDDELWIWQAIENGGRSWIVGRPISDANVIVLDLAGARAAPHAPNLDVVWDGTQFIVAACDAVGRMGVQFVPREMPRQPLILELPMFPRPLWCGAFFQFSNQYGDDPTYPANVTVVAEGNRVAQRAAVHLPIIVTRNVEALADAVTVQDRVVALYIGDTAGWRNAEKQAAQLKLDWAALGGRPKPVLWYITPGEPREAGFQIPPSVDWLGPQFYFEGQSGLGDRLWRLLGSWLDLIGTSKPWVVIAQAYDRNHTWSEAAMRELVSVTPGFLTQLVVPDPRVRRVPPAIGLLWFAVNRPGGVKFYPALRAQHQAVFNAIPAGTPHQEPTRPPVNPPRFTISEPKFPLTSTAVPFKMRCVATLDPAAGEPDWIEWQYSRTGKDGPWTVAVRNEGFDKDHTFNITTAGTFWFRARAGNAAGIHQTGAERKLTVTAALEPQPEPEPEPLPTGAPAIPPTYDQFVTVEGPQVDAAIGLQNFGGVLHTSWRRLNEGWTHANVLRAIRNEPLDADHLPKQRLASPTYDEWLQQEGPAILAALAHPSSGDLRHNAYRRFVEGWTLANIVHDIRHEPLDVVIPEVKPRVARTGLVRPDGRAVRDDQGLFHPFGKSLFWSMQGWKHERDHFKKNAEWVAAKRFDYVRILTEVGWAGREIDPSNSATWGDWGTVLREVMDYLYGDLGLRVELTLIGKGTNTDPMWLTREVCNIIRESVVRQHAIMNIECANEYTEAGGFPLDMMKRMARVLCADTPNIVALSSPGNLGDLMVSAREVGATGFTFHPDRGDGDHKWRQVRQLYDFKNMKPFVGSNNEPAGPGSSVATQTNLLQLAMTRAVGVMCGGAMYVLHTGTGVFGDGKPHPTAGPRPANFWEIENIDAIVEALRGVATLIPEGVENWTVANTQWTPPNPVAPFQPHHHWEGDADRDNDGNINDGVNKAYSAGALDGRVIQMPCGVRGHVALKASYPLTDVVVYDPLTLQPRPGVKTSFDTGEVLDLPGSDTKDAMVAYIIHGRR